MKKPDFLSLFRDALESAAQIADDKLGRSVPRDFAVELHGAGHSGDLLTVEQAAAALYLGEEKFYRVIDISVVGVGQYHTRLFVRASAHEPVPFQKTWNQPQGSGPFKQIEALNIRLIDN